MAIESNGDEVVLTYDESYYKERASVEEIYLEVIVEELRSKLISETPPDNCRIPASVTEAQLGMANAGFKKL